MDVNTKSYLSHQSETDGYSLNGISPTYSALRMWNRDVRKLNYYVYYKP